MCSKSTKIKAIFSSYCKLGTTRVISQKGHTCWQLNRHTFTNFCINNQFNDFLKWSRIQFRFTVVHRVKVAVLSFFCVLCYRTIALSLSCYCIFVIAFLPSHYQASRLRSYTTGGDGQTMFHCNLYFVLISDVIVFFRVFTRNDKKVPSRTTIKIYSNTF